MSDPARDRVLVVGGSRGTGLLIARVLLRRGYPVRVLARDPVRAAQRLSSAVEVVEGDMTKPDTLAPAVRGAGHIIVTAGVRSAHFAREDRVKRTDYQGVVNVLSAARRGGMKGRFLYMNALGVTTPSLAGALLNLWKRNTLVWRRRVEEEIRSDDGLDYTIIRAGFLVNGAAGRRAVVVGQTALPLSPRYRIAREDVAEAFVEAVEHPCTSRATFDIVWGKGSRRDSWSALLDRLKPD
jgi:uncharacterized protein YbjT (DUF2867 family)